MSVTSGTFAPQTCGRNECQVDFSLNVGVEGDVAGAPVELNGTYSSRAFSARAKALITSHEPTKPLYMYIAPQNVHLGCGPDKATQGIQAPCETVGLYPNVLNDTFKVQSAVTTELDYVVGNVTDAKKAKGLWKNTGESYPGHLSACYFHLNHRRARARVRVNAQL